MADRHEGRGSDPGGATGATQLYAARVRLRPLQAQDAAAIFTGYAQDPEVTRYLGWHPHRALAETQDYVQRCDDLWVAGRAFPWGVVVRASDALVGVVEVRMEGMRASLGYAFARPYWGQGLASEAVRTAMHWALSQPGLYRVWAVCDVANGRSARLLERIGMQCEGVLRRWMLHPNVSEQPRDCYCYSRVK